MGATVEPEVIDLAYLDRHWGSAYDCYVHHGMFIARRRDDGSRIRTSTAEALLAEIRHDYQVRPVPRENS